MKTLFSTTLLLSVLVFSACKKDRKLPNHISVKFVPLSTAFVTPNDDFTFADPNDPNNPALQVTVSPRYTGSYSGSQINTDFNATLKKLLSDNNIGLLDSNAAYELRMSSLVLSETMDNHAYFDSCFMSQRNYFQSSIQVSVTATLYFNGVEINSWTRVAKSQETARKKTDRCNCPKVRKALLGPSALLDQAAQELYTQVSKQLYYELYR